MALNEKEILITLADQTKSVGAALSGNVVDTIPTDFESAKAALSGLTDSGYISEEGVALSTSFSLTDFREMNRGTVRKGVDSFDGTLSYSELQLMNETALKRKFGADNVSTVDASAEHGKQTRVKIGSTLPPVQTHAFKLKDGDVRAILWVPRGQITNGIDMTFAANSIAELPIEISCYDDGNGGHIYLFFEDGEVMSA